MENETGKAMRILFRSLSERWRPEDILAVERQPLGRARSRVRASESSMASTFDGAKWPATPIASASALFGIEEPEVGDAEGLSAFIDHLKAILQVSNTDFKTGRMPRDQRKRTPEIPRSHRAYNKRFRAIRRLEEKLGDYRRVSRMRKLAQVAKSNMACFLPWEEFSRDWSTARFVAYLTATMNRRSVFTFGEQARAFDEYAERMFRALGRDANWLAVAHVYPREEVLSKLTDEQRGKLLGTWFGLMRECAEILGRAAGEQKLDLVRLVVRRGNDSSTWNEAAGAFNRAREGWMASIYSMGWQGLLDQLCPGKALRLMAADVVRGHAAYGDGLEPDTAVWGELPKPWEVLLHGVRCDRALVEAACAAHGIEGKGWVAPRPKTVAEFTPTPELVHGVVVSSPALARALKEAGYFAGPSKGGPGGYVGFEHDMDGLTPTVSEAWEAKNRTKRA